MSQNDQQDRQDDTTVFTDLYDFVYENTVCTCKLDDGPECPRLRLTNALDILNEIGTQAVQATVSGFALNQVLARHSDLDPDEKALGLANALALDALRDTILTGARYALDLNDVEDPTTVPQGIQDIINSLFNDDDADDDSLALSVSSSDEDGTLDLIVSRQTIIQTYDLDDDVTIETIARTLENDLHAEFQDVTFEVDVSRVN